MIASSAIIADPAYAALKERVLDTTGLAYYRDKDEDFAARIARRLTKSGVRNCAEYAELLRRSRDGEGELDLLITDLTIGETYFFRNQEQFAALKNLIVPDLIRRNRSARMLRIWSAGCATGAEPYSVSILLKQDFSEQLQGWDVSIVGTDINREFLSRARDARFEDWALRSVPDDVRFGCFSRNAGMWTLEPRFRAGVAFQYHNLVEHHFPSLVNGLSEFDLILCRNVMIYFAADIVGTLVRRFHETLVRGGWLVVGHSEPNIETFRMFQAVHAPGAVLYRRHDSAVCEPTLQHRLEAAAALAPVLPPFPDAAPPFESEPPTPEPVEALPPMYVAPPPGEGRADAAGTDELRALIDRGDWTAAAVACDRLVEREKLSPILHFYRGLIAEQTGRHPDAEAGLRRAIYLDREFVLGHYYLGMLLERSGRVAAAARSFQNAIDLLGRMDAAVVFPDADAITAGELLRLAKMQREVVQTP